MILHSLYGYYERLKNDAVDNVPLPGFSSQKIHFALVVDRFGKLIQTVDLRESGIKKPLPKQLTVPEAVIRTVGLKANFMWDNTSYTLGMNKASEITVAKFEFFKKLHCEIGENVNDEGIEAVLNFLSLWYPEDARKLSNWDEIAGSNVVFQLDGDLNFIHDRPKVREAWIKHSNETLSEVKGTCLVEGKKTSISQLHQPIKGVRNAQTRGGAIVSFNKDAFRSYEKKQNFNAPVGEYAAFAYTTALNHLLSFDSRQKVQIGDATTVFWTERDSPVEGFMGHILDPGDDAGELLEVRNFLEGVREGKLPADIDPEVKFYILGLSPNAARISVRFWYANTVGEISESIGQHFNDLAIIKSSNRDSEFPGMWQLLRETATQRKTENISPVLSGAIMRSILTGAAYPQSLLTSLITRIRADQTINYLRAAMIKACLVRKFRISKRKPMEVGMALNKESTNIAYRLGRLFAVLEKAQKDAIPGANTTIKDRFFGSASATPRVVFPQLLRLAQHHIQKSDYGFSTDKMIEDILQEIHIFPAHLKLDDQGLFALGYYHQRQSFFSKQGNKKEETE